MKISARVENRLNNHQVTLTTNGQSQSLQVSPKATGFGSSANGGELLFLALATCYCNDVYREAAKRGIQVERVEVEVDGDFERSKAGAAPSTIPGRASTGSTPRCSPGIVVTIRRICPTIWATGRRLPMKTTVTRATAMVMARTPRASCWVRR